MTPFEHPFELLCGRSNTYSNHHSNRHSIFFEHPFEHPSHTPPIPPGSSKRSRARIPPAFGRGSAVAPLATKGSERSVP